MSKVLIVGSTPVASNIATHLIRAGVGTIYVVDDDVYNAKNMVENVLILHPNSNIQVLDTEPDHIEHVFDAIVFVNQPLQTAIKVNQASRDSTKFVYVVSKGVYGMILSDFGDVHPVYKRSDEDNTEYQGTVTSAGKQSYIEVEIKEKDYDEPYSPRDTVNLSMPKYIMNPENPQDELHDTVTIYAKVQNVERKDANKIKMLVDADLSPFNDGSFSIKKVEDMSEFRFVPIKSLVNKLMKQPPGWREYLTRLFTRKMYMPEQLIISPGVKMFSDDHLCTIFGALTESSIGTPSSSNCRTGNSNHAKSTAIANSNVQSQDPYVILDVLKNVNVPAVITLIGSLAAQEVIKGLTSIFTPADLIVVDRSDIFPNKGLGMYIEDAQKHLDIVKEAEYLMVGVGALGCEYLKILEAMGVEHLTAMDNDSVDVSNLTRQSLFTDADVGLNKATAALQNLRKVSKKDLDNFVAKNAAFTENFHMEGNSNHKNLVLLSAVDNVHTRLLMDNYAVEQSHIFVEAGIHGMQCSTSITAPFLTEPYAATMGTDSVTDAPMSCSVKGIPKTTEDTVFHAVELFSWIFYQQHRLYTKFIQNPVETLKRALEHSPEYFCNVANSLLDNANLVTGITDTKDWATQTYEKYFNIPFPLKDSLIEAMSSIKKRTMTKSEQTMYEDMGNVENIKQSFIALGKSYFEKHHMMDQVVPLNKCMDAIERLCQSPSIKNVLERGINVELNALTFDENMKDDCMFLYAASNIRAHKFGLNQKDMASVIKVAKGIIPAISTTVGVAASMAILELYKALYLMENNTIECEKRHDDIDPYFGHIKSKALKEIHKRDNVTIIIEGSDVKCYNYNNLVALLKLVKYKTKRELVKGMVNNYFNLGILTYVSNDVEPAEVIEITSKNAILSGQMFSLWDHIVINDSPLNSVIIGPTQSPYNLKRTHITIADLADVLEKLFDVTIEVMYASGRILDLSEDNRNQTIQEALQLKNSAIIQLKARDNETSQIINIPNLKYTLN
uniref:ThiF family protein n=2 Tax=Babesia bovis TaxID=5865 RepID=A7ANL5_BABBO|eukprot:XP_001611717.1 ThiF family protein [Babesia bovis T2Bo]